MRQWIINRLVGIVALATFALLFGGLMAGAAYLGNHL